MISTLLEKKVPLWDKVHWFHLFLEVLKIVPTLVNTSTSCKVTIYELYLKVSKQMLKFLKFGKVNSELK